MIDGFLISDHGMRELRRALWQTHRLDNDTDIVVVAGDAAPQYASVDTEGAVMTVGFKWVEMNHPKAFAEIVSQRLQGNTRPRKP